MATLGSFAGLESIRQRLEAVQRRRKASRLAASIAATATLVIASLLIVTAAVGYWPGQPPAALRWALLVGMLALWAAAFAGLVVRAALWRQAPPQVARFVEQALPECRNDLINAILLSDDRQQASASLVNCAIQESAVRSNRIDVTRSVSHGRLKRWATAAAAAGVLLLTFAVLQPGPFKRGLLAVAGPVRFVPNYGSVKLNSLTPGDADIFAGDRVTIVARINNPGGRAMDARVLIDGAETPRPMLAGEDNTVFTAALGPVHETFRYAVCVGDSRWPSDLDGREFYTVNVLAQVAVQGVDLLIKYPEYMRAKALPITDSDGTIEAPVGSRVDVTLRLSASVPNVLLLGRDGKAVVMHPSPDRKSFAVELPVNADGAYRMEIQDTHGRTFQRLPDAAEGDAQGYYRIHAIPDTPPQISFTVPNRNVTVAPGGKLPLRLKATDDHGLISVIISAGREGKTAQPVQRFELQNAKSRELSYTLDLGPYAENDVVVYYATATDNRRLPEMSREPQTVRSREFKVTLQDPAKATADRTRLQAELRAKLLAILKMQQSQRVNTAICLSEHDTVDKVRQTAAEIVRGQTDIHNAFVDLLKKFKFDDDTWVIRDAVNMLVLNQTPLAVRQARVLSEIDGFAARIPAARPLGQTQDEILDQLHTMLAIMPSLGRVAASDSEKNRSDDLPADVRQKLAKLKADMEKFIEAQKKVIEATGSLAKKPVDTFTPEDEKLLRELLAEQEKWEKFLDDQFSDLSKLAEQDMSNPLLLKELVSIKTDVTMAKDALSKKATEVALAAENGEVDKSKQLTTNLEKWLPDEPDRLKWSMEDPTGQDNVEQPELPNELEDMIGDLLEQEEDLFQEMEDQTSKYPVAGDGLGWDAVEGPMPSMAAGGVTGNQMPNSSEQSGRSGEGRSAKSSGEYVEDKAVGKGGRKTPTRLTPDPYQKGQINDVSKESPGGATGGGKISGAGTEGMEGPVPPKLEKEMGRLAEKQAALINRAERMREKFKNNDYANFQFLQAITLMNRVRNDLEQHRYQNALRQRDVTLGSIRQTGEILDGRIDVTADTSAGMPKYIRDDISDAMTGKLPAEYRDVMQQYYRRLSEGGGQ